MKEFSHPGSADKTATDINQAIESTITVARNEWKYVAEISTQFGEDLPPVVCDAGEINQVILNLVVNAAHSIKEKGKGRRKRKHYSPHADPRRIRRNLDHGHRDRHSGSHPFKSV
jgi:two-component system NtrC family sensor kinase